MTQSGTEITKAISLPGELILSFINSLEIDGIPSVYLRNYENLPQNIGNDVDLLIPKGKTAKVLQLLDDFLIGSGWRLLRIVEFGPMAVFMTSDKTHHIIHLDLFERLDWHCIPFADPTAIIQNRIWNGTVHHPAPEDEIYLNVMTRLMYHGYVREKTRIQYGALNNMTDHSRMENLFIHNLGPISGANLLTRLELLEWKEIESSARRLRIMVIIRGILLTPIDTSIGVYRYLKRSMKRLINPSGIFVVFEGSDGVGKTSIIDRIVPSLIDMTGKSNILSFHWKPCKASFREPGHENGAAMNPRCKNSRDNFTSLLFLLYHWLGFWYGWLRYVRPALVKNRPVVGDRYSYEFFLDPRRLRLSCPDWLLKLATLTTPRPSLTIALIADPETICSRKQELTCEEIHSYQERLHACQKTCSEIISVSAEASPNSITDSVVKIISAKFTTWGNLNDSQD